MPGLVEVVSNLFRPYYTYVVVVICLIVAVLVARYAYETYYKKTVDNKFANVANANRRNKEAEIMFFRVDWCPHCKTAKPEWDAAKAQFDGTTKNGYKIEFSEHNCTTETPQISQLMKQYKVEGYPTIKLVKDGKVIDFDAKPTQDSIAQLINTAI